jgi:hypothetical protein
MLIWKFKPAQHHNFKKESRNLHVLQESRNFAALRKLETNKRIASLSPGLFNVTSKHQCYAGHWTTKLSLVITNAADQQ